MVIKINYPITATKLITLKQIMALNVNYSLLNFVNTAYSDLALLTDSY